LFDGLDPNTTYFFFARIKETTTHAASPASASRSLTTDRIPLGGAVITLAPGPYVFTGSARTPTVTSVVVGGVTLGTQHYTVGYTNNVNAGTATVTVTATTTGHYSGSAGTTFTIEKATVPVSPAESSINAPVSNTVSLPMAGLLPDLPGSASWGTLSYSIETAISNYANVTSISENGGILTISLGDSEEGEVSVIPITVTSTNYEGFVLTLSVKSVAEITGISVNRSGLNTFPAATYGYGTQTALSVTVGNTGNVPTGALTIALTGTNAGSFTLSRNTISSIGTGGSEIFTVRPNTGLAAGAYTATVTVSGTGKITSQSFNMSFSVDRREVVITADNKIIEAGTDQPVYTYTVTGLVPGESLVTNPTLSSPTADINIPGSYAIVASGAGASANYTITYVNGTLTVTAPAVIIPAAITNLRATPGNRSVTLTWTEPDNGGSAIIRYEFRRRTGTGTWSDWTNLAGTETTRTVTGLTNGTSYGFQVRAVNTAGHAEDSNTTTAVKPKISAPTAVADLRVSAVGSKRVTLRWTAPNNGGSSISRYQYRQRIGTGKWSSWKTLSGKGTSRNITGLSNGKSYEFQIRAVNSIGNGEISNMTIPATPVAAPAEIKNLKATAGNGQVRLRWKAPGSNGSAILRYEVRQRIGNGSWGRWTALDGLGTDHTIPGLRNGTSYRFQVRAVNAVGSAKVSNAASAKLPRRAPAAIEDLQVTAAGDRQVTLNWTAPNNGGAAITRYQIRQSTDNGAAWGAWSNLSGLGTTRVISGLVNETSYTFQVRAINTIGTGAASNTATAKPADMHE